MNIIQIPLPTPFPVGDVNVYLIKDEPLTLIDTGAKTPESLGALREGLRVKAGCKVSDIKRIVLTHTHEDHFGLTDTIVREAHGAQVLVHAWETGHHAKRFDRDSHGLLLKRAGVSEKEIANIEKLFTSVDNYSDPLDEGACDELVDDASIEFATGSLRVIHTPGHTPGSCSLVRESDRTIIAGDCVLKRITPNPILSPDPVDKTRRFRSLEEYLVSLARIRSLAPTLIYSGHGEAITDYEELFNRYLRLIRERGAVMLSKISNAGSTAADIAHAVFPNAHGIHRFLALSEACAHLDLLVTENKLAIEMQNDVEFYRPR
ncbi:MAG: MBL fold metallo-hydrolase [Pyrinomonadaceae bacterium MAG19_C2-C3]|nr:MBL fold metallo-hydrolase [Pyrinomonadaceae bacterium MAG19_C2-C3]